MAIEHPYRLRSIKVRDFKSIRTAEIEFHPISIVVGANSSGKSSLLQVILAISQAVRSRPSGTVFPLNGEYVRFGRFSETARFRTERDVGRSGDSRSIGIQITLTDESTSGWPFEYSHDVKQSMNYRTYIDWSVSLVSDSTAEGEPAKVDEVHLICHTTSPDGRKTDRFQYKLSQLVGAPIPDALLGVPDLGLTPRITPNQGIIKATGNYVETGHRNSQLSSECDAIERWAALPHTLFRHSSFSDAVGYHWWRQRDRELLKRISGTPPSGQNRQAESAQEHTEDLQVMVEAATKVAEKIHDTLHSRSVATQWQPGLSGLLRYFAREYMTPPRRSEHQLFDAEPANVNIESFLRELARRLEEYSWAHEKIWVSLQEDYTDGIRWTSEVLNHFFDANIKYLGPLRKAPQVLYNPRLRDLDLGLSGEYTAAILHANSAHRIVPISSMDRSRRVTLESEVNRWLKRFGLATRARLEDLGRLGIGLQITPIDSEQAVDLTAVGVGVSQLLPVIVLCLLAEPGDLIILEQPELHLHPALQQQLGDFLLDCAHSGRQLLVETHSEHLVNRVRRRVADTSGSSEGMAGLLFAEHRDGITEFRASEINPYGGSEIEWPEGFFDVSAREAQAMVSTSLTKRYRDLEDTHVNA